MVSVRTSWDAKNFAKLGEQIRKDAFDKFGNDAHQNVIDWILKNMSEHADGQSDDFLITRILYIFFALEEHAAYGGLSKTEVRQLVDAAEKILQGVGIRQNTSRLSFIFADLYRLRSLVAGRDGDFEKAAWLAGLTRHMTTRPSDEQEISISAMSADLLLRLGYASLAIASYNVVESFGKDTPFYLRAMLGLCDAFRLSGDMQGATQQLNRLRCEGVAGNEVAWRQLCIDAQSTCDATPLVSSVRKEFNTLDCNLTAKLWAYGGRSKDLYTRIARLESLRKRFGAISGKSTRLGIFQATRIIEEAYDNTIPLRMRIEKVCELVENRRFLPTIEQELLTLAACFRVFLRYSQESFAQLVLAEYNSLSSRLSNNANQDVLGLIGNINQLELLRGTGTADKAGLLTSSRLGRASLMLKAISKTGGVLSANRVRRILASGIEKERIKEEEAARLGEILADTCSTLKGGMMKVGQTFSLMAESTAEFRHPLGQLHFSATPTAVEKSEAIIKDELGAEPAELFSIWNPQPVAVGSIGQIYSATLADGTDVAVKVQHPGIKKVLEADLGLLGMIKPVLGRLAPGMDTAEVLAELRERIMAECDYTEESANQNIFGEIFAKDPEIFVPRVFSKFSSASVLTTEFVHGRTFEQFCSESGEEEKSRAGNIILRQVFKGIFQHNIFNCDPHPGNYVFMDDGRIAFLDYGCIKNFTPEFIAIWRTLIDAAVANDVELMREAYGKLGYLRFPEKIDMKVLMENVRGLMGPVLKDEEYRISWDYAAFISNVHLKAPASIKYLSIPREAVMLARMTWGLGTVIAELSPTNNWHRMIYGI